jgi:hypothetical protein
MRKRPNPDSEENIKRIDTKPRAQKQTHGFQVHFLRGDTVVTKMFSDAVHGGKEAARKAARKYRRQALSQLPPRSVRGFGSAKGLKSARKKRPAARRPAAKKRPAAKRPAARKKSRRR